MVDRSLPRSNPAFRAVWATEATDTVATGLTDVALPWFEHTRPTYREAPDTDEQRFRLVLEGRNLLTGTELKRLLDLEIRSFWRAVGLDDWLSVHRTIPCVVVQR